MTTYRVSDDQAITTIEAASMAEAVAQAKEDWQDGSWDTKCLVDLRIAELDEDGDETGNVRRVSVECGEDPPAPECTESEHDWRSPHSVVGGIESNPGVWACGGTTYRYKECCAHCGAYKIEVHYGSQRNPGQCDTVEYEEADEASLAWVESRQ